MPFFRCFSETAIFSNSASGQMPRQQHQPIIPRADASATRRPPCPASNSRRSESCDHGDWLSPSILATAARSSGRSARTMVKILYSMPSLTCTVRSPSMLV